MQNSSWDVIIVGAGTAGLSAAQMLGRSRRRTLVIDGGQPRNRFAAHVHGVLGHDGAAPAALLERGRHEAEAYGVKVSAGVVTRVNRSDDSATPLSVELSDGSAHRARAVIIATGVTDELPDIPGLSEHWGSGVLHCPYCHGWEVRDQRVGVLLTSALAVHQAQLVRQLSDDVVVFTSLVGELDHTAHHRLTSRGIDIESAPVAKILGDGHAITGVELADGRTVAVAALFAASAPRPLDAFLSHLNPVRTSTPIGDVLEVDGRGMTSVPGVYAAGNVVNPMANVPVSMGAGAMVGATVNAALVEEEFDAAASPTRYWEGRYAGDASTWSGRPNATFVDVAGTLTPGRALDLGCGEGADVMWLAEQGWHARGIDISQNATDRARRAAAASDIPPDRARFDSADLTTWETEEEFDLVTASFFQSPVPLERTAVLRRSAARVAPGGHMLLVSHASPPSWADARHAGDHMFLTPDDEVAALGLATAEWTTVLAETRTRTVTAPDGSLGTLDDCVVLLRRAR